MKFVSNTANYSPKPPGAPVIAGTEEHSAASESPKRRGAPIRLLLFLARKALGENRLSLVLLLLAVAIGVGFQIPNRANLAGFRDEIMKSGHLVVLGVAGVTASAREHPYERTVGADLTPGDDHGALLGERLAKKLGANVGDEVNIQVLLSTRPRLVLDDEGVGNYKLVVRGLVGFAALDSVFVNWGFLASETGDDRSATGCDRAGTCQSTSAHSR